MVNPSTLVALLEKDLHTAIALDTQDIREIVLAGLKWQSPTHWPELALCWIEQGFEADPEIISILKSLKDNKSYSQNFRHRTRKVVTTWERVNSTT